MNKENGGGQSCLQLLLRQIMSPFNAAKVFALELLLQSREQHRPFHVQESINASAGQDDTFQGVHSEDEGVQGVLVVGHEVLADCHSNLSGDDGRVNVPVLLHLHAVTLVEPFDDRIPVPRLHSVQIVVLFALEENRVRGQVVDHVIDHVQLGQVVRIVLTSVGQRGQMDVCLIQRLLLGVPFRGDGDSQRFAGHLQDSSLGRLQLAVVQSYLVLAVVVEDICFLVKLLYGRCERGFHEFLLLIDAG